MRRFASGVTTESHQLYPTFMRQLSHCIFEVDSGDACRLSQAKRSELEGKHGMVGLTDGDVIQRVSKEEWRLHCRRRTRGAEETAVLIQNLLDTFSGPAGRDTLDIPLLDALRIEEIWSTQRRHLSCIQDWPGVQADQGRGQPSSWLHLSGVLPPPPPAVHPRDVCQLQILQGVPDRWTVTNPEEVLHRYQTLLKEF
ncbi:uncharacterized protein LOC144992387 [Oryzias latipes]